MPNLSDQPPAKRQKHEEKKLMKDIPSNEFERWTLNSSLYAIFTHLSLSLIDLYKGPEVTIIVQKKKFILPKRLLCHLSPVFDVAFNSNFKEGHEQEMTLQTTITAFEHATKWMFTGNIAFSMIQSQSPVILLSQAIDFLKLVHFLQLVGPFTQPMETAKSVLVTARQTLTSQNIEDILELPDDHPLRILVLKACVKLYVDSNRSGARTWDYQHREFMTIDGYAAGLFKYFDVAFRKKTKDHMIKDPLAGELFSLWALVTVGWLYYW